MSNNDLMLPEAGEVPAHIAERMKQGSALGDAVGGGIKMGEGVPRISIKASRFRLVEDGAEVPLDGHSIDVVIVGANPRLSKTWYESDWDPNAEPAAPECFSLDGISPHADATKPQNDVCAGCPHDTWGSKVTPTGQKVKACSDVKRIAVLPADDVNGKAYLLPVSPAALRGLNDYHKQLSVRQWPPESVRTRLSFDPDASYPKLVFKFGGFLDAGQIADVDKRVNTDEITSITGEAEFPQPLAPVVEEKPKPVLVREATTQEPTNSPQPVEESLPADDPEAAKAASGFGAAPAAKDAAPEPTAKAEDKPAPAAKAASGSIEDDISKLLDEVSDDA